MSSKTREELQKIADVMNTSGWGGDYRITIGGDVINSQVAHAMTGSQNLVQAQPSGERRDRLDQLHRDVQKLIEALQADKKDAAAEAAENLEILVKQATSAKPNRRWYEVAAVGLLDASKYVKDFTGNIAGTIKELGKTIWPDFSMPEAK